MSDLANTGARLNLVKFEYHQSFAERHPNLVFKFSCLKDLDDVDPLNISVVYVVKESEQGNRGLDVTTVIISKTPFLVNRKHIRVYLALGEGVVYNTIFSWPFLQTITDLIMI